MEKPTFPAEVEDISFDRYFQEFIEAFKRFNSNGALFPKLCRVCDRSFNSYAEYVELTVPKGHVFEDGSETMGSPWTMLYRHCVCGNTLVLTLTDESFPELEQFWEKMRLLADTSGKPLKEIVSLFREECDGHIMRGE
jgi:hypothetical protein